MGLMKRPGDFSKCKLIYIVGAILLICGLPLMITGIAATFSSADLVGYVGGLCIFFGIGFFLVWYMFTIESKESNLPISEYDPNLKNIRDIVEKSRSQNRSEARSDGGFSNLAYSLESAEHGQSADLPLSEVTLDRYDDDEATLIHSDTVDAVDGTASEDLTDTQNENTQNGGTE